MKIYADKSRTRNVKTWIIMHRQPNPSSSEPGTSASYHRIANDCNANLASRQNVLVPSVLRSDDMQNDNSSWSMSSSSDNEGSGYNISLEKGMDPLTAEALKAIRDGKTRRRIRDCDLPPEERERRQIRRERNKLAAAKCRKRRVDQTMELQMETEQLRKEQMGIEQTIAELEAQKEELAFILQAHKNACKLHPSHNVKTEPESPGPLHSSRPSTLPIRTLSVSLPISSSATEATGIPITTPSGDGLFQFGLEHQAISNLLSTPTPTSTPSILHKKVSSLETPSGNTPSSPTFLAL